MLNSVLSLTCVALCIACLSGFAWSICRFFTKTGSMPARMKVMSGLGAVFSVIHVSLLAVAPSARLENQVLAAVLYAASLSLFYLALRANRALPLAVAFDPGYSTHLITRGPYAQVRHPFYCAYLLFWIAGVIGTGCSALVVTVVAMGVLYRQAANAEEQAFLAGPLAARYARYRAKTGMFWPVWDKKLARLARFVWELATSRYEVGRVCLVEDEAACFKIREEIFGRELGRDSEFKGNIAGRDVYDDESIHLYCRERETRRIIGTVRLTPARIMAKDDRVSRLYDLDGFSDAELARTFIVSRLAVLPDYRMSAACYRLMQACYAVGLAEGVFFSLIVCEPHLQKLYERAGFRATGNRVASPYGGERLTYFLDVYDFKWLRRVSSPFWGVAKKFAFLGRPHAFAGFERFSAQASRGQARYNPIAYGNAAASLPALAACGR